ncbi:MAG: helicase associated domain-containing protein [Longicatena sp.]
MRDVRYKQNKREYKSLTWDEWYLLCVEYYSEYKHLCVPCKYRTENGYRLGRWIERQRKQFNNDSEFLANYKKLKLENIGMIWSLESRYPWDFWVSLCKEYKDEYGTTDITSKCQYKGLKLGGWIVQQRKNYKMGRLSTEKIEELKWLQVGLYGNKRYDWNTWYAIAKNFYERNGHIDLKVKYIDEDGNKLGSWIYTQREKYRGVRESSLTKEQVQLLEQLHIKW